MPVQRRCTLPFRRNHVNRLAQGAAELGATESRRPGRLGRHGRRAQLLGQPATAAPSADRWERRCRGWVSQEGWWWGAPTAPQNPPRPGLIVAAAAGGAPGGGWAGGSRGSLSSGTVGWGWPAWRAGTGKGTARAARSSPSAARPPSRDNAPPLSSGRHFVSNLRPRQLKGHSTINGVLFLYG